MKFSSIVAAFAGANMAHAATQPASQLPICNPSKLRTLGDEYVTKYENQLVNCIPLDDLNLKPKTIIDPKLDAFKCLMRPGEINARKQACSTAEAQASELQSKYGREINCDLTNLDVQNQKKVLDDWSSVIERYKRKEKSVRQVMETFANREIKIHKFGGFVITDYIGEQLQTCLPKLPTAPLKVQPRPTGVIKKTSSKRRQRSSSQTPQPLARNLKPTAKRGSSRAKPNQTRPMKITPAP